MSVANTMFLLAMPIDCTPTCFYNLAYCIHVGEGCQQAHTYCCSVQIDALQAVDAAHGVCALESSSSLMLFVQVSS